MVTGFVLVTTPTIWLFLVNGWYTGWTLLPSLAVTMVYPLSGMAVGGWFAALQVVKRTMPVWLTQAHKASASPPNDRFQGMTVEELCRHRASVVENLLQDSFATENGSGLAVRLIKQHLQEGLLRDFGCSGEPSVRVIGPAELLAWFRGPGLSVATDDLLRQVKRWQLLLATLLLVLIILPILLHLRVR
jgi:hypothetical protein